MKLYLTLLLIFATLVSNADISQLKKLNSYSNVVTRVDYSDGLEVDEQCNVRFLMGGLKNVGPYRIDGVTSVSNKYLVTEVSNSIMDVHIYGQRRILLDLVVDNKLNKVGTLWIHMPPTNGIYKTCYDWHMNVVQTNCWDSSGYRTFNVGYVSDPGISIYVTSVDLFYKDPDSDYYFTSYFELGLGRYFTASCPLNK